MFDITGTGGKSLRQGHAASARQNIRALQPDNFSNSTVATLSAQSHKVKYVFIHGALASPAIWKPVRAGLQSCSAAAFPLPGHHPWSVSPEATEELLRQDTFLELYRDRILRLAEGPVHIVAHSTGSLAALLFAWRYPELVEHLTLMGSFADGRKAVEAGLTGRTVTMPVIGKPLFESCCRLWLSSGIAFERGISSVMSADGATADAIIEETLRQLHADLRRCAPQSLRQVILWLKNVSLETVLSDIQTPCTLVLGQRDPVVDTGQQLAILQGMPNCLALLTDLGHLPMLEQPDHLRRLLFDNKRERLGRSAPGLPRGQG